VGVGACVSNKGRSSRCRPKISRLGSGGDLLYTAGGVDGLASALWGTGVREDDRYKCTEEEKVQGPSGRMTDLES